MFRRYISKRLLAPRSIKTGVNRYSLALMNMMFLVGFSLLGLPQAKAQELKFSVSLSQWQQGDVSLSDIRPMLVLQDLDVDKAKLSFGLMADRQALGALFKLRSNFSWGPLGNVLVEAEAFANTLAKTDLRLSASGVLASSGALRAEFSLFNVQVGHFDVAQHFVSNVRPHYALNDALAVGLSLGGNYRLSRLLVLEGGARATLLNSYLALDANLALVLRQIIETDDLTLKIKGLLHPVTTESNSDYVDLSYLSLGAEYRLNRRNIPALSVGFYGLINEQGFLPGGSLSLKGSLKEEDYLLAYGLELRAQGHAQYYLLKALASGELSFSEHHHIYLELFALASSYQQEQTLGLSLGYGYRF
ncbi:MAG: hypothetical protein R2880_14915 [Deinococcales bacterium]